MSIQSKRQLENTRAKLKLLEDRLRDLDGEPVANVRTRELTRQSLKRTRQSVERRNRSLRSPSSACNQVGTDLRSAAGPRRIRPGAVGDCSPGPTQNPTCPSKKHPVRHIVDSGAENQMNKARNERTSRHDQESPDYSRRPGRAARGHPSGSAADAQKRSLAHGQQVVGPAQFSQQC